MESSRAFSTNLDYKHKFNDKFYEKNQQHVMDLSKTNDGRNSARWEVGLRDDYMKLNREIQKKKSLEKTAMTKRDE